MGTDKTNKQLRCFIRVKPTFTLGSEITLQNMVGWKSHSGDNNFPSLETYF